MSKITASEKAKQLGAKSLKQVADTYGCTVQNLDYQYKNNPKKFEIIVMGVVVKQEGEGND